mmetsp:Transcript_11270/g.18412  ORF Transcript_11270/g.18412 Transcript_11270/m.18412 type:complete len:484 (-) Transcript_11270:181-1632(-)
MFVNTSRNRHLSLLVFLLVCMSNQWARYSLGYLGGISTAQCPAKDRDDVCYFEAGEGDVPLCAEYKCNSEQCSACQTCYANHSRSEKNLRYSTCITPGEYGYLLSYGFITLFSLTGLLVSRFIDKYNRKMILLVGIGGWTAAICIQGPATSFTLVAISRALLGIFESFAPPCILSFIADLYVPSQRARANAVYTFGVYLGDGFSSLTMIIALGLGWRFATYTIGTFAALCFILTTLFVWEPRTSLEEEEAKLERMSVLQTLRCIFKDKAVLCVFLAGPLRYIGGLGIGAFMPLYFASRFPDDQHLYATINIFIVMFGGSASAFIGSTIVDLWVREKPAAPALVPALSSILGVGPFLGIMYGPNFTVCIICLFVEYLFAEAWLGSAYTILQRVPPRARGTTIAIFQFLCGLVGSISPVLIGALNTDNSWTSVRDNMAIIVSSSYVSTFFVFLSCAYFLNNSLEDPIEELRNYQGPADVHKVDTI